MAVVAVKFQARHFLDALAKLVLYVACDGTLIFYMYQLIFHEISQCD